MRLTIERAVVGERRAASQRAKSRRVGSGFALAAILKKHPVYRNIPILAATGSAGDIARQRCLSAGCDDFISKPFAISVLERRLANLVSAETPKPLVATGATASPANKNHADFI